MYPWEISAPPTLGWPSYLVSICNPVPFLWMVDFVEGMSVVGCCCDCIVAGFFEVNYDSATSARSKFGPLEKSFFLGVILRWTYLFCKSVSDSCLFRVVPSSSFLYMTTCLHNFLLSLDGWMLDTLVQFASSWCIPWPMTCLIRNCQVHMHIWVFDAEPRRNWRRAFEQLYQDCPTCAFRFFRFWSRWLLFRSFCALSELRQGVHILFEWWSGHMFKVLAWISDFQSESLPAFHGTHGTELQGPNLAFVLSSGDAPLAGKHGMAVFQGGQRIKATLRSFETFQVGSRLWFWSPYRGTCEHVGFACCIQDVTSLVQRSVTDDMQQSQRSLADKAI